MRTIITMGCLMSTLVGSGEMTYDANMRAGYIQRAPQGTALLETTAVGGYMGLTNPVTEGLELRAALYVSEAVVPSTNNEYLTDDNQGYALLGEASIKGSYGKHTFNLGRQRIATAHADDDDIRMVPNLFEAYAYAFQATQDISIQLVYFNGVAGWDGFGDPKQPDRFVTMSQAFDLTDAQGDRLPYGMIMGHITFAHEGWSAEVYDYVLPKAFSRYLVDMGYAASMGENLKFSAALQYDTVQGNCDIRFGSDPLMQSIDAQTVGAMAHFDYEPSGTGVTLGLTKGIGQDPTVRDLGGGVWFTSLEENVFNAIGDAKAQANAVIVEQDASKLLEGLAVAYFWGEYFALDRSVTDFTEQDIYVEYAAKNYTVKMMYAHVVDQTNGGNGTDIFRATLDIPFEK